MGPVKKPEASFIYECVECEFETADLILSSESFNCLTSCAVQFTSTSINSGNYQWDFGDGVSSSDENPVHIFSGDEIFKVELIVSNNNGPDVGTEWIKIIYAGPDFYDPPYVYYCPAVDSNAGRFS